jgi:hypothetical protein
MLTRGPGMEKESFRSQKAASGAGRRLETTTVDAAAGDIGDSYDQEVIGSSPMGPAPEESRGAGRLLFEQTLRQTRSGLTPASRTA